MNGDKWTLTVIVIYRPPYSPQHPVTVSTFLEELGDNMGDMLALSDNVVIMGDINIPYNNKDHPDTLAYLDLLYSFDLQQHVNCKTCKISDHHFVTASMDIAKPQVRRSEITYRKMKDINQQEFDNDLKLLAENFKNV